MSAGIILAARTGSTRMPNKWAYEIVPGVCLTEYVLRRAASSYLPVCLAVPAQDDQLAVDLAYKAGKYRYAQVWSGSETDVLGRYYDAARFCDFDPIVRITGDCPLTDPEMIRDMVAEFELGGVDYLSNRHPMPTMPSGLDVEVFSLDALRAAHFSAIGPDREHVTKWFYNTAPARVRCRIWPSREAVDTSDGWATKKLSVDTPVEAELVRALIARLPQDFGWRDVQNAVLSRHV